MQNDKHFYLGEVLVLNMVRIRVQVENGLDTCSTHHVVCQTHLLLKLFWTQLEHNIGTLWTQPERKIKSNLIIL